MSFLTLNGIAIPTAAGGRVARKRFGVTGRSHLGRLADQRIALKRVWQFKTVPLDVDTAGALVGIIRGQGQTWSWETDESSDGGLVTVGGAGCDLVSTTAADGDAVTILGTAPATFVSPAVRGSYGASFCDGSSNLLTSDESDLEGAHPNGWVQINPGGAAAIAQDSSNYWQGTKSLKITTDTGAQRGARTTAYTAASGGTTYTGSVFLKGDAGGETVRLDMIDNAVGVIGTYVSLTLSATEWRRAWVTATTDGAATGIALRVYDLNASDAQSWYVDGAQIEAKSYPTWWMDGGTTRAADDECEYPPGFLNGARNFSFGFWGHGPYSVGGATNAFGIAFGSSGTDRANLFSLAASGYARFSMLTTGESNGIADGSDDLNDGAWHHLVGTYLESSTLMTLYVDGAEESTDTLGYTPTWLASLDLADGLVIGNYATLAPWNGLLDDVFAVPYCLTASQVAALYASGTAPAIALPDIIMAGDVVRAESVQVSGRIISERIVGTHQSGAWDSAGRVIEFELEEI